MKKQVTEKISAQSTPCGEHCADLKTGIDILLTEVGSQKIPVTKVVKDITGLGLKESKDLVDAVPSSPQLVKQGLSTDETGAILEAFQSVGATVRIVVFRDGKIDEAALPEVMREVLEKNAEAKRKAEEEQAEAQRRAEEEEARRDAVLILVRDKVINKIRPFAKDLEEEIDWFMSSLVDSGVDSEVMPTPKVAVSGIPGTLTVMLTVTCES